MRDALKSSSRWLRANWFWPLVLLALPNCTLDREGTGENTRPEPSRPVPTFNPGTGNLSTAVMCDIPKVRDPDDLGCATPADVMSLMSMKYAAVALAQGEKKTTSPIVVLDFSQNAQNDCGAGVPRKTEMLGPFPDGLAVCFNCPQMIPMPYADSQAVCVAKCEALVAAAGTEPQGGVNVYCEANARVSTNFDPPCYENVCSMDGTSGNPNFVDPRRPQEHVKWTDSPNVEESENNIKGTTGTPTGDFSAGAASVPEQAITTGDAWVEFAAGETNKSHVLGLSPGITSQGPTIADIAFAISLNYFDNKNEVYILENGNPIAGPLGSYAAGERFRVRVKDNNDGSTATISFWRITGVCMDGTACLATQMAPQLAKTISYPLRVDASFREANATINNVTLVRIKSQ